MKIGIVCWGLSPPFGLGGISRYVNRLANELGKMGHDVVVFYANGYNNRQDSDLFEAIHIQTCRIPVFRIFQYCRRLNKAVSKFDFDILNVHIAGLAWGLEAKCPVVLTIHTTSKGEAEGIAKGGMHTLLDLAYLMVFKTIGQAMETPAIRHSSLIVVVNPIIGEEISKRHGISSDRINVVEPAIEPRSLGQYDKIQARELLGIGSSEFVVLYVGRLEARKNPCALLDGFASIASIGERPLRLIFCGDGALRGLLQDRVTRLDLGGQVSVLGQTSEQTLHLLYSAADVYCLPSEMEGFPATLLESRAYGLPVIVGPFPGVERIVKHQENGIVLDVVTADSIAAAIKVMLSSPDCLRRMAQANASALSSRNSWGIVAEILYELYERSYGNFRV